MVASVRCTDDLPAHGRLDRPPVWSNKRQIGVRSSELPGLIIEEYARRVCRVRNLRRERQLEGIADAKARGVYKGRRATINPTQIKRMKANGMGPFTIAKTLKIGRASAYLAE